MSSNSQSPTVSTVSSSIQTVAGSATSASEASSTITGSSEVVSSSTSSATPTPTSFCVQGEGSGGYAGLCDFSCYFGFCPSPCTCNTYSGTPNTPPALTGEHGYALLGLAADYGPLCDFTVSHGYFPDGVCTKTAYSPTLGPGLVCVQGVGSGGYTGLCDFCCHFGHCPDTGPGPCECTLYGAAFAPPPENGHGGIPAPGLDASYSSLCSFACNHDYCPDTCVQT